MASSLVSQLAVMIKTEMRDSPLFPFDKSKERDYRKPHMKTLALNNNPIIVVSPDIQYFHLGNESAERRTPHYHILEDARTIQNPGKGTKQTLGSQAKVFPRNKRDYGVLLAPSPKQQTLTQEYRQEYRTGRRSYSGIADRNRVLSEKERKAKLPFRYNIHFAYIERILESILPGIANFLNLHLVSHRGLNQGVPTIAVDNFTGEIIGG